MTHTDIFFLLALVRIIGRRGKKQPSCASRAAASRSATAERFSLLRSPRRPKGLSRSHGWWNTIQFGNQRPLAHFRMECRKSLHFCGKRRSLFRRKNTSRHYKVTNKNLKRSLFFFFFNRDSFCLFFVTMGHKYCPAAIRDR